MGRGQRNGFDLDQVKGDVPTGNPDASVANAREGCPFSCDGHPRRQPTSTGTPHPFAATSHALRDVARESGGIRMSEVDRTSNYARRKQPLERRKRSEISCQLYLERPVCRSAASSDHGLKLRRPQQHDQE
jgi:hypothetical protein